jgi:hypothetical protein
MSEGLMACIALASARKVTIPPCITARTAFSMFCGWRIAKINLATSAWSDEDSNFAGKR